MLKYISVDSISKKLIEIFERAFQSVASKDKLAKCSFKYFDENFRNLTYVSIR